MYCKTQKDSTMRKLITGVAIIAFPTQAIASVDCTDIQERRNAAIASVDANHNALRECLLSYPDWRDEAKSRFYDVYIVTETISGEPRRMIISHGSSSSTAYIAPATRDRTEKTQEFVDIGIEARLKLLTPETRAKAYSLGEDMESALADEFLLCHEKVDSIDFVKTLGELGWDYKGGMSGIAKIRDHDAPYVSGRSSRYSSDYYADAKPLTQRAVNYCTILDVEAAEDAAEQARIKAANERQAAREEDELKIREARYKKNRGLGGLLGDALGL